MNKIYCFVDKVLNRSWGSDVSSVALAEDGDYLASHISSNESWAKHDMGVINSAWHHEAYSMKYPEGFEVIWLKANDPKIEELRELNKQLAEAAKTSENG